jgi:hypothetical protein
MNSELERRTVRASQLSASGLELLDPNLVFGTAWFWTLPEVHEVQKEIDALTRQFRRYLGLNERLVRASHLKSGNARESGLLNPTL